MGNTLPVSGCQSRRLNIESFSAPKLGMILIVLYVESMQIKLLPCIQICSFCQGGKNATTTFGCSLLCI